MQLKIAGFLPHLRGQRLSKNICQEADMRPQIRVSPPWARQRIPGKAEIGTDTIGIHDGLASEIDMLAHQ